jgi:hypothetical protein
MAPELDPERVRRALAHPTIGPQLERLGVKVRDTIGGVSFVICPPAHAEFVAERVELADEQEQDKGRPRSRRGRNKGEVDEGEANRAAEIYVRNGGNGYAVWARYNPKRIRQSEKPELLSRHMVEHLVTAIARGWLPWDAAEGRLRISDEFRTSRTRFVIPRRKPAS